MRYAIISDFHGNSIGLEAVIAAIEAQGGVDGWLILGDLCAIGADPVGVIETIRELPHVHVVKGNTDHYIANNIADYPPPSIEDAQRDSKQIRVLAEISRSFAWTQGMITAAGHFDWIDALPVEIRLTLPDGTKALLVHACPGQFDGWGMSPADSDETVAAHFGCDEDLILVGHVHWAQERRSNGKHVVNPGPVGNPIGANLAAHYAILEADETGYQVRFEQVGYDLEAVLAQVEAMRHPTADYVGMFYRGEFFPEWFQESA